MTSKDINFRIVLPDEPGAEGIVLAERNGLSAMVTFVVQERGSHFNDIAQALPRAFANLFFIEQNPPPDIKTEESKPATPPKKPQSQGTTIKPAATPPPPVAPKWYTNPDTGEVKMDNAKPLNEQGWFGPFNTKAEADAAVPEWLRSAFKPKKKR